MCNTYSCTLKYVYSDLSLRFQFVAIVRGEPLICIVRLRFSWQWAVNDRCVRHLVNILVCLWGICGEDRWAAQTVCVGRKAATGKGKEDQGDKQHGLDLHSVFRVISEKHTLWFVKNILHDIFNEWGENWFSLRMFWTRDTLWKSAVFDHLHVVTYQLSLCTQWRPWWSLTMRLSRTMSWAWRWATSSWTYAGMKEDGGRVSWVDAGGCSQITLSGWVISNRRRFFVFLSS